jgi:uncharacterized membrane protein YgdD (TMEM256/DUF423 family)
VSDEQNDHTQELEDSRTQEVENSRAREPMNNQLARNIAAIIGFFGVLFGAFGAHVLRSFLERLDTAQLWRTAVLYHLVHALMLLVMSGWRPIPRSAYCLILIGVVIFSGSLYAMALTNFKWFGAITPIGGIGMLSGWLALVLAKGDGTE